MASWRNIYTLRYDLGPLHLLRIDICAILPSIHESSTASSTRTESITIRTDKMDNQLAPLSPPLGINPAYCVPKQTVLVMKEKVWSVSGDTFHIVDENGHEVVQCRGQAFSLSDRKEFADSSGRPLFSLRTRHFTLHKSFYAEDGSGKNLFEVKGKFSRE